MDEAHTQGEVTRITKNSLTENKTICASVAFAGILDQMWSFDGKFSSAIIQPMLFYNFDSIPGAYVAYNDVTSVNWLAKDVNKWTVPLGLSIGRTFDMGGGNAFDTMIGPYYNVERPYGSADWVIRFGIS